MTTPIATVEERQALLTLAREAIVAHLTYGARPHLEGGAASAKLGAFVSLHVANELRGCIGYLQSDRSLGEVVARCAVSAAAEDPRFPPLRIDEIGDVHIEISILGPIEPVHDVQEIEVGRHGLIVADGFCKGREMFLAHTCLKAGLKRDAWKSGAQIFRFEAEVFAEQRVAP
jgi:AmmeMemoRadiSam system protein A